MEFSFTISYIDPTRDLKMCLVIICFRFSVRRGYGNLRFSPYIITLTVGSGLAEEEEATMQLTVLDTGTYYRQGLRKTFSNNYVFVVNVVGYNPI